jgi:anti-sigma factor (TIGR02949 family)
MDCAEARELRHLYLDGELDPVEAPVFEAHLRGCPACAALYAREQALSAALRQDLPRYKAPMVLRARVLGAMEHRDRRRWLAELRLLAVGWNPAALAASLMLAIVASSAVTSSYLHGDTLAQEVVASHVRSLMEGHLTDVVSSSQHTVKPWFNGKLDISPPAADLAAAGYELVGGRLDYIARRSVAALVYRRQQHVINVLVWPAGRWLFPGSAAFTEQGYHVIHFDRDGLSFWVVSDLARSDLEDFAGKLKDATPDEGPR